MVELYQHALKEGSLGLNIHSSLIKLIYKGGDKTLVKNWRLVTLLNVTYTILATRLVPILPEIISKT